MAEVNAIKQAQMVTQALERVQEAVRRQGEQQQQSFATSLNRHVDARGQQVNEGDRMEKEELDPNAQQKREERKESRPEEPPPEAPEPGKDEDEERGRHIDVRA